MRETALPPRRSYPTVQTSVREDRASGREGEEKEGHAAVRPGPARDPFPESNPTQESILHGCIIGAKDRLADAI